MTKMSNLILPENYDPLIDLMESQRAIIGAFVCRPKDRP